LVGGRLRRRRIPLGGHQRPLAAPVGCRPDQRELELRIGEWIHSKYRYNNNDDEVPCNHEYKGALFREKLIRISRSALKRRWWERWLVSRFLVGIIVSVRRRVSRIWIEQIEGDDAGRRRRWMADRTDRVAGVVVALLLLLLA